MVKDRSTSVSVWPVGCCGRSRLERKQASAKVPLWKDSARGPGRLARVDAQRRAGTLTTGPRQTVEQFLSYWLQEVVIPSVRPSTYTSYEINVRRHILPQIGRVPVASLTPQAVQSLLNDRLAAGLFPRRSVRACDVEGALRDAVRWGIASVNVATLVDPPKLVRHEIRPLTLDESRKLLDAVRGQRLEALYTVALALGLRRGEALGLRWEDLELESGQLRVPGVPSAHWRHTQTG